MIDDMPGNRAFDGDFPAFSIHAIIEKVNLQYLEFDLSFLEDISTFSV